MTATATEPNATQGDFLLALFRPLLTVDEARYLLREPSPQTVIRRLENGTLRGVDISAEGDAAGRRELRIYRYAVEWLYTPATQGRRLPLVSPETILPHRLGVLRRAEVALILNCTSKHVGNLRFAGPLQSSAAARASADRCPRILRAELIAFLADREIKP